MTEENNTQKDEMNDKDKEKKAKDSCSTDKSAGEKKEGSCGCS